MVRCDKYGNYNDSTPCCNCLDTIKILNIKRIVYSSGLNTFNSCSPCDIEIDHESAGSKFLKNRYYKESIL